MNEMMNRPFFSCTCSCSTHAREGEGMKHNDPRPYDGFWRDRMMHSSMQEKREHESNS